MKKNILLLLFIVIGLFIVGCTKDENNENDDKKEPVLTLSDYDVEIEIGKEFEVTASTENKENPEYEWVSGDNNIATVSDGVIIAVNTGDVDITVTLKGTTITKTIEVKVIPRNTIYNVSTQDELDEYLNSEYKNGDTLVILENIELEEINIEKGITLKLEANLDIKGDLNLNSKDNKIIIEGNGELLVSGKIVLAGDVEINNLELNNDLTLLSNTNVLINDGAAVKNIIANNATSNIKIVNKGTISEIDLNDVEFLDDEDYQIEIISEGKIINNLNAVVLPNNANTTNTKIEILNRDNYFLITETENFTNFDVIVNGGLNIFKDEVEDSYIINITQDSGTIKQILESFFANNLDKIANIKKLEIVTDEKTSLVDSDFAYFNTLSSLESLDLSQANCLKIPDEAMMGKTSLKELNLPEGIKEIGKKAFYETSIKSITTPISLTVVGVDAFGYSINNPNNLQEVHILNPDPLKEEFVYGFPSLAYFFVPVDKVELFKEEWNGLRSYSGYGLYYYNSKLFNEAFLIDGYYVREVQDGVEIVAYFGEVLENGLVKESFTINGEVLPTVSIGNDAFRYAKNSQGLTVNLTFPDTVKKIGNYSFYEFMNVATISSLDLNKVEEVGENAFEYIAYTFTTISSPELKIIKANAFNGLSKLESIDVLKVEYLGDYALQSNSSLTELYMPNLKYLGSGSINNNGGLRKVTVGPVSECGSWVISNTQILEWDFTHDLGEKIMPTFGAGWNFYKDAVIYVNADVLEDFQARFPGINIQVK